MKDRVIALSLGALTALATIGWVRSSQTAPAPNLTRAVYGTTELSASAPDRTPALDGHIYNESGQSVVRPRVVVRQPDPQQYRERSRKAEAPVQQAPQAEPAVAAPPSSPSEQPVPSTEAAQLPERPVHSGRGDARTVNDADSRATARVRERSTKQSALIIGGGVAAGAAIGGLAGGGKGAAIGALSGGTAGLIYDRMTRRKQIPGATPLFTP